MSNDEKPNGDAPLELGDLYADREPPADLEDRVVADLVAAGRLGRGVAGPARRPWAAGARWAERARWPSRLAAGLILFGLGWGVGSRGDAPAPEAESRFMLLLWEGADFSVDGPPATVAAEYTSWARSLAATGMTISGDELGPDRVLLPPEGLASAPPDHLELGGYFIVGARGVDEARAVAESHPHRLRGGWIEVAPIVVR